MTKNSGSNLYTSGSAFKLDLGRTIQGCAPSNLRAKCYQRLADLIQRKALDGLRDATTIGQLAGIRYELDASGRIKIESKDSARQRGVRSPDRATR